MSGQRTVSTSFRSFSEPGLHLVSEMLEQNFPILTLWGKAMNHTEAAQVA